jgi:hypothetical protein
MAEGDGRDGRGRFVKGNSEGRGNPFARRVAGMREAMLGAVSEADVQEICKKLVEKAREGDVAAAKLVLVYVVGHPRPAEEPDRMDEQEWRQRVANTVREGECEAVTEGMTVRTGNLLGEAVTPAVQEQALARLREGLAAREDEEEREEDEDEGDEEKKTRVAKSTGHRPGGQ